MKLISFRLKTSDDIDTCLLEFQGQCLEHSSAVLVSILTGWAEKSEVLAVVEKVHKFLPEAIIVGSSTSGEIWCGTMSEHRTVVHFMVFSTTRLKAHAIDFATTSSEGVSSILTACHAQEEPVGIELLIASNGMRTYDFIARLKEVPSKISIFGGIAGSTDGAEPYVFAGGKFLREGAVAIIFAGSDLTVQVTASQGWLPLGPWFCITEMKAENVIVKLDNQPAHQVYQRYLDISREELERENSLFPLLLERHGQRLLRLPVSATDEGALVMSADCRPGERVRLTYGDPSEILDACHAMHKKIGEFGPQAILLFNCVTRRFFLHGLTIQELLPFQNVAPCAGFYTGGEIARMDDGETSLLNMSLVSAAFREGDGEDLATRILPFSATTKTLTGTMKLMKHLTHFIAEVSKELEEKNDQLAELATTDRLTRLYNRGEIESIVQKTLDDYRKEKFPLSAIMMDLDNFKKVNDVFGHDMGDQVLKWAGEVLRKSIRRSDAAGRWGGEEFFIILPGASLEIAKDVAERIRQGLACEFTLPDGKRITASFGVAEFSDSSSYIDFYRLLDANLYRAKQTGKNRVCSGE